MWWHNSPECSSLNCYGISPSVLFNGKRGVGEIVARVAKCSMIIKHHKQLHTHTHPTTPYPHRHVFLLSFWVSFIQSSPPDAYHCGRSIKCNVCRREIIGNMWWELKTLSHFKLPIICSKGECIVLQSAWKKGWVGGGWRRRWSRRDAEVSQLHLAEMFRRTK